MISDFVMESNTNNPGQFVFRVDDGVSNKTCSLNTGNAFIPLLWYLMHGRKNYENDITQLRYIRTTYI